MSGNMETGKYEKANILQVEDRTLQEKHFTKLIAEIFLELMKHVQLEIQESMWL